MITENLKAIVNAIVEETDPLKVVLFGSYARDEETEDSDYDLYVIMPDGTGKLNEIAGRAYYSIWDIDSPSVDIVVNEAGDFAARKNDRGSLEWNVANEGVVVYAKG